MAVYERTWRRWTGRVTRPATRWTVITRYGLAEAFASRLFTALYVVSFLPTVAALVLVYLSHNLGPLAAMGVTPEAMDAFTMGYVRSLFMMQAVPAFFIAVIVVPPLISSDLTHGGLPLYLARPIGGRWAYLAGKAAVPALLLSPVTWIAGLTVYVVKSILADGDWWSDNLRLASGFVVGHGVWIAVVVLMTLAVSSLVTYRWAARGALFALFFVLAGFSAAVNVATGSHWGSLLNPVLDIGAVVSALFRPDRVAELPLPLAAYWIALVGFAIASVAVLTRTLRAHQEIR
jgi:hypothetical protein